MTDQPIRVVFCSNGGLNGALVMDRLLRSPRVRIVGLIVSTRMLRPNQGYLTGALEFVRRSGVAYTLALWCSTALADWLLRFSPIAPITRQAKRLAIPMIATRQINDAMSVQFLKSAAPDLLVSAFFNQRIDATVAALPRSGAVNIHPSPLPEFRGVDPVFHATLQHATTLGASVHAITAEFDQGPIFARETRPADAKHSVLWNTAYNYRCGADLLTGVLDTITNGVPGEPQSVPGGYDSWPTPSQVAALQKQGKKLVAMEDLLNMARGNFSFTQSGVDG